MSGKEEDARRQRVALRQPTLPECSDRPRPTRPWAVRTLALVMVAVLAAGCAAGGLTGKSTGAASRSKTGAQTCYAGAAGLKVYKKATNTSKVVGQLSLHQKVVRSQVESGYAYIKTSDGKLKGWVVNTRLLRRLPATTAKPASAAEAQEEESAATDGATPGGEAASTDATASPDDSATSEPAPAQAETAPATQPEAPAPAPAKAPSAPKNQPASKPGKGVTPSVFDPY